MFKTLAVTVSLTLVSVVPLAAPVADENAGMTSGSQQWNLPYAEKRSALTLKGNGDAGRALYQAECASCHLPTAGGNPDGSIPQLAGQHSTVVIKQLADTRAGLRKNPTM